MDGGIAVPYVGAVGVVDAVHILEAEGSLPNANEGLVGLFRLEDQDGPTLGILGVASAAVVEIGILRKVGQGLGPASGGGVEVERSRRGRLRQVIRR